MNDDHEGRCSRLRENSVRRGRISVLGGGMLLAMAAASAFAQTPAMPSMDSAHSVTVVIGFVGGFVKNDDSRHPEVQIIQRLSKETVPGFHAVVYENRRTA